MALRDWRDGLAQGVLALKAAMRFPGAGGGGGRNGLGVSVSRGTVGGNWFAQPSLSDILPGGRSHDWARLAGDVEQNSIVAICLGWIADNIVEPEVVVRERRGEKWIVHRSHPLLDLLNEPNEAYDWSSLLAATATSYSGHGNGFWKIAGEDGRPPSELWFVPRWEVKPLYPRDGSEFLTGWVHTCEGDTEEWTPEEVCHFRFGIDPRNPRLGISRLRSQTREIVTDNEASVAEAVVMLNHGVVPYLLVPTAGEVVVTPAVEERILEKVRERTTGLNRGKPTVLSQGYRVERLGLAPSEMGYADALRRVESRVCGALRLPGLVVGLNVGDLTKTFANYSQARKAAYEDCIVPVLRRILRAAGKRLLPFFERDPQRWELAPDLGSVAALREDLNATTRRAAIGYRSGLLTRDEGRALIGQEPAKVGGGEFAPVRQSGSGDTDGEGGEYGGRNR